MRPRRLTANLLCDLLRDLVKGYTVDHGRLEVKAQELTTTVMLTVKGSTDDHRRLVGSRGRHVWSLQRIAGLAGLKLGKTVRLSLLDPFPGDRGADLGFEAKDEWDPAPFMQLLERVVEFTAPDGTGIAAAHAGHNTTVEITLPAIGEMFTDYARALQALFFAIGKMHGRIVELCFIGPQGKPVEYDPL